MLSENFEVSVYSTNTQIRKGDNKCSCEPLVILPLFRIRIPIQGCCWIRIKTHDFLNHYKGHFLRFQRKVQLQPPKEFNKHETYFFSPFLGTILTCLDPDPLDHLNPDPIWIRNTECNTVLRITQVGQKYTTDNPLYIYFMLFDDGSLSYVLIIRFRRKTSWQFSL